MPHTGEQVHHIEVLEWVPFNRLEKGRNLLLVQNTDVGLGSLRQDGPVCRVCTDQPALDGLIQGTVQYPVDIFHSLGIDLVAQHSLFGAANRVYQSLDVHWGKRRQLNGSNRRIDVVYDDTLVRFFGMRLGVSQVVLDPGIQPLTYCCAVRGQIGALVNLRCELSELLRNLLLGLSCDGPLNLLPSAGVVPDSAAGFPIKVLLSAPFDGYLADCTGTGDSTAFVVLP